MPAEHPMACTIASLAGAEFACQPRDVGQCAAQADSLGDPTDTSQELIGSPSFAARSAQNALGKNAIRMKQATSVGCGAESDWQRGDVGSLHGVCVPETPPRNTRAVFNDGDTGH